MPTAKHTIISDEWRKLDDPRMQKCHVCGDRAMPMLTVTGPNYPEPGKGTKHFCSVHCFWTWINRVIKSRDEGGRLDRQINWD